MTVKELVDSLHLEVLSGSGGMNRNIDGGYVSDLLSDVMGNADAGNAWITLQTHKNIMAIASLKELSCIILVKGLTADEDTLKQSDDENIPILSSKKETFELAGKLFQLLYP